VRFARRCGARATALLCATGAALAAHAAPPASPQLEELTWPELRERIAAGASTVLLPVGGTEQNGPHMALGKHNVRVRVLAARIALRLGDAIVAPVLAYVPEGAVEPPTQHMRWPGTISIPEPAFEATLEGAARSLHRAGFCHIVFLGDHGGYRASLDRVAARINGGHGGWAAGCGVHALPEYYRAASTGFAQTLKARGYAAAEVGSHAGLADTALALAVDPTLVRTEAAAARPRHQDGVIGDPGRATAELGRLGLDEIVEASVAAIRAATRARP
jgi:creatinine amidohydrolase/Fe(II)-dependent formamide hydrolase-like protein